ncbi:hypothetical protein [Salinispira pacifica]|uniref:Uncharacterized protein n=1 Tax=Salinispira pacifica TaxID=1307761 RepID=V5WE19_9SPIO|nr:hypothetical protein [Salinispira pacifica]AHC13885.1 hypothetical protein L21SP2_0453 [Salinispira pacifica]
MISENSQKIQNTYIQRERTLNRISVIAVVIISVLLLLLYAYSLGQKEIAPPSPGMSNAIPLFSAEYGFSRISPGHVDVLSDGENSAVASVDGSRVRVALLGPDGKISQNRDIPADISQSRVFHLHQPESGAQEWAIQLSSLALVVEGGSQPGIRYISPAGSVEQISADGELLRVEGEYALFREDGGLYAVNLNRRESDPLVMIEGRVLSYAAASVNEGLHAAAVIETSPGIREIVHSFLPVDSLHGPSVRNLGAAGNDNPEDLMDIHVTDNTLSMLFLFRDIRFGVNRISALQWKLAPRPERKDLGTLEMPMYRSKYRILNARENFMEYNAQIETLEGVNIAGFTMSPDEPPEFRLFTKTRSMSKFAGLADMGPDEHIIFYDVENEKRQLYLASSNPGLIEQSIRVDGGLIGYVAGMTLAMTLSAGGLGLIFLFTIMVAASLFLTSLLSTRFKNPRLKAALPAAAGVALHISISLIILNFLMNETAHLSFRPAVGGGSQAFFLVSLLLSLIAAGLSFGPHWATRFRECTAGSLYLRFFIYQYVFYTLHMGVYVASSMILTHI